MEPNRAPQCIDVAAGDLLISYASGKLGADERRAFEAHCAACLACEEQLVPMRRLLGALAMLPSSPADAPANVLGLRTAQQRHRVTIAVAVLTALACTWMLASGPRVAVGDGADEIGALRARIARLEQQNAEILSTVESGSAPGASVQPIYGRMPIPPSL